MFSGQLGVDKWATDLAGGVEWKDVYKRQRLDGTLHYVEVIFNTLRRGWSKDNVGSHIVRNNVISDCEQTGICGRCV